MADNAPATPTPAATSAAPTSTPTDPKTGLEAAAAGGSTAAERAEAKKEVERRKYKLRVDGGEQELALSDDEISVRLQKGLAADKRMAEAAEIRKQFAAFREAVKRDPFGVLKDPAFGIDLEAEAEKRLADKYRQQLREAQIAQAQTEEEKQRLKLQSDLDERERKLKEYADKEKVWQEDQAQRAQAEMDQRVFQEIESDFMEALQAEGITKSYETLYMMAEIARLNLDHGIELTPRQMAAEVRGRVEAQNSKLEQAVRSGLQGQDLLDYLGESTVKAVLQAAKAKLRGVALAPKPAPTPYRDPEAPRKIRTPSDWKRELGLKPGGRL